MADQKDYYETLGVSRDADDDTIRKAFRKLSKKYHPDLNHAPGAEQKFKDINEAYQVLSDPQNGRPMTSMVLLTVRKGLAALVLVKADLVTLAADKAVLADLTISSVNSLAVPAVVRKLIHPHRAKGPICNTAWT